MDAPIGSDAAVDAAVGAAVDVVATSPAAPPEVAAAEALWLAVYQVMCRRAAHELKGALNGVVVNLEVVRSRSERADSTGGAPLELTRYATAASEQLGAVIAMTEALLGLGRPAPDVVDVALIVRRVDALLGPAARANGRTLELGAVDDLGVSGAPGNAVRLAVGACVLAAVDASPHACVRGEAGEGVAVRIDCADGAPPTVAPAVVSALAAAGIRVSPDRGGISISFPR